jgi:hypothetical protein
MRALARSPRSSGRLPWRTREWKPQRRPDGTDSAFPA